MINKKSMIYAICMISMISMIFAYSTYGAPSEFGNETTTTCGVGGDDGIVNCTGNITGKYFCMLDDDCRNTWPAGGGGAGDKWLDEGIFISPNSTFADNVQVYGWIRAWDWTNVTIVKSQISDLWATVVQSLIPGDSSIILNDSTDNIEISVNMTFVNDTIDYKIDVQNTSMTTYVDAQDVIYNNSAAAYTDSKLITEFFNASTIQVITGTPQGAISDLRSYDGISYNLSEVSSDIELILNFTGIIDINQLIFRYKSDATESHNLFLFIWDYINLDWESYKIIANTEGEYVTETVTIYDSSDHLSGGVVQVRFYSNNAGGATHKHQFDWVSISDGPATPSSDETDPHAIHKDGNIQLEANWDAGSFNITALRFKGFLNWSWLQNIPSYVKDWSFKLNATDQRYNETDLALSINTTSNIESLNFVQGAHTTAIGNCSGDQSCTDILYNSDLPLPNQTLPYCGNITGATSDLCTITSGGGVDGNASSICSDNEVLLGQDTPSCVNLNNTIDNRDDDTFVDDQCSEGDFVMNISGDTMYCDTPAGGGDINSVQGDEYITNGSGSGSVTLRFNESKSNETGDLRWIQTSEEGNLNVNSSDFWDTLDTVADILGSLINNNLDWVNFTQIRDIYYNKTEVDNNLSLRLLATDQRYNETDLALSINTTGNIESLNFVQGAHITAIGNCSVDQSCDSILYDSDEGDLNTNSSDYWDAINSPNATQFNIVDFILNIDVSWLTSLFYTKAEVDNNLSLRLLATDQRYNETDLALSINTTTNIEALGFTQGAHTVDVNCNSSGSCSGGEVAYMNYDNEGNITVNENVIINTGNKSCFDGSDCNKYVKYNGTVLSIQG